MNIPLINIPVKVISGIRSLRNGSPPRIRTLLTSWFKATVACLRLRKGDQKTGAFIRNRPGNCPLPKDYYSSLTIKANGAPTTNRTLINGVQNRCNKSIIR